ncbi:MAG: hypothetical protein K1X88_15570 [Nannocystaceae bacterium]|nr:hypothetical protein [Nannocystaceae bacterium]
MVRPTCIRRSPTLLLALTLLPWSAHAHPFDPPRAGPDVGAQADDATLAPRPAEDALPAETLHAEDITAQLGATAVPPPPPLPVRDVMSAQGVDDPFPDGVPTPRARSGAILLGLGGAVAVAAVVTARLTLRPDCTDERDLASCTVPDRGDIGVRVGRLVATAAFAIGGAAFGALGGRELGQRQRSGDASTLQRRRRLTLGLGGTATMLGTAGLVAGTVVFATAAAQALAIAKRFTSGDTIDDPQVRARVQRGLDEVHAARVGLMLLAAAPMVLATGAALLAARPRRSGAARLSLSPWLGPHRFGAGLAARF